MAHGHGFTLEVGKSPNRLEMIVQIKDESLGKLLVANSTFFSLMACSSLMISSPL